MAHELFEAVMSDDSPVDDNPRFSGRFPRYLSFYFRRHALEAFAKLLPDSSNWNAAKLQQLQDSLGGYGINDVVEIGEVRFDVSEERNVCERERNENFEKQLRLVRSRAQQNCGADADVLEFVCDQSDEFIAFAVRREIYDLEQKKLEISRFKQDAAMLKDFGLFHRVLEKLTFSMVRSSINVYYESMLRVPFWVVRREAKIAQILEEFQRQRFCLSVFALPIYCAVLDEISTVEQGVGNLVDLWEICPTSMEIQREFHEEISWLQERIFSLHHVKLGAQFYGLCELHDLILELADILRPRYDFSNSGSSGMNFSVEEQVWISLMPPRDDRVAGQFMAYMIDVGFWLTRELGPVSQADLQEASNKVTVVLSWIMKADVEGVIRSRLLGDST